MTGIVGKKILVVLPDDANPEAVARSLQMLLNSDGARTLDEVTRPDPGWPHDPVGYMIERYGNAEVAR